MNESKNPEQTGEQRLKKRSMIERVIVWTGIAFLSFVVLIEWTSMQNYGATLEKFETIIQARQPSLTEPGLKFTELNQHVHGFAYQGVLIDGTIRQRTYQWPSLFKTYKLGVAIDAHDRARNVETLASIVLPIGDPLPANP